MYIEAEEGAHQPSLPASFCHIKVICRKKKEISSEQKITEFIRKLLTKILA